MFIGKQAWDPWQICKQIAVLQVAFYIGLYVLELFLVAPFVGSLSPSVLFTTSMVGFSTWNKIMLSIVYLINSCLAALAMRVVVARAKKCWDFGATMYIVHGLATVIYEGFTVNWAWWSIFAACMVATILLGEYLCVQFEMADIPVNTYSRNRRRDATEQDIEAQIPLKTMSAADSK